MKYKTCELSGKNLRHAVALACGYRVEREDGPRSDFVVFFPPEDVPRLGPCASLTEHGFAPDIKWEQGGPIIDRKRIQVAPALSGRDWVAAIGFNHTARAPRPLPAAMRAYVRSELGEEVEL